ncbi:MAG: hypothetical protein QGI68_13705 [Pseudomonadales bacterium]|jgi:hypothetical protein|nr:hypothetical protein [Pseudomonadales bacterium]MDP7357370.1 hypothetical protein [Pseudomonadales bacterium]MDP7596603.1 hypothetical protein [Pseudomonadales bacterium]HJN53401.1 hypothetical protein [Pseudomonadales bacterium]|tara:strand:- start:97 stop:855 length:759 start_codon:yes stop_codon:yes gene_type:complete
MKVPIPEVLAYIIAYALGIAVVYALSPTIFSPIAIVSVVVVGATIAGIGGDNLGDAIITSMVMVVLSAIVFYWLPIEGVWTQAIFSALVGMISGKLSLAIYSELKHDRSTFESSTDAVAELRDEQTLSPESGSLDTDRPASDHEQSPEASSLDTASPDESDESVRSFTASTTLQEYDRVRVISLGDQVDEYEGTEGVSRAPRVGDEAVICHEYDPRDANSSVVVEKADRDGNTIWLADFDKAELELVYRPAE